MLTWRGRGQIHVGRHESFSALISGDLTDFIFLVSGNTKAVLLGFNALCLCTNCLIFSSVVGSSFSIEELLPQLRNLPPNPDTDELMDVDAFGNVMSGDIQKTEEKRRDSEN